MESYHKQKQDNDKANRQTSKRDNKQGQSQMPQRPRVGRGVRSRSKVYTNLAVASFSGWMCVCVFVYALHV